MSGALSELLIPVLALVYVAYLLGTQIYDGYQTSTVVYGAVLASPVVVCACVILHKMFKNSNKLKGTEGCADDENNGEVLGGWQKHKRPVILFAGIVSLVILMEPLGYLLAISGYLFFLMVCFGVRAWPKLLAVSIGTTAMIYLIFGLWLELPLPLGLLEGFLK
jgi:hypothetical protein